MSILSILFGDEIPLSADILEKTKRRFICGKCKKNKIGVCTVCGCNIKLKTYFFNQYCPLKKW